jgi:hypothetical protein
MADMLNDMMLCEELFHTPTGVACADFITEGRRETWPIRSKRFRTWMQRCYFQATGGAASAAEIRSALDLLEARAQFDVRSTSALRNMADAFISTSLMSNGGPSTSDLTDGGWSNAHQCASAGLPGYCRCPYPNKVGPLRRLIRFSIFRAGTTSC